MYDLREELLDSLDKRIDRETNDEILDKLYSLRQEIDQCPDELLDDIDIDGILR